ncbi:GNAT family N-acetyltransferase [uncultured Flavobacterium sp.]|uniref:GNAT family N-acetyltransferase n=1 Tax=uncultured Flavobacterium sp. TaxID=165435 RepID=UPI0030EC64D2
MITIKEIDKKNTYPVRHLVLRKGKPIETCYFEDDEKDSTRHFGVIIDEKVVGVVSLFEQKNENFNENKQYQIRGMAVLDEYQQKGYGKLLIQKVETYCLNLKADTIWFNARENAKSFYQKMNYTTSGKPFDIKNIGLHYIMFKRLT